MKRYENYDKFIVAAGFVCGACLYGREEVCPTCPVRLTIDNYNRNEKT